MTISCRPCYLFHHGLLAPEQNAEELPAVASAAVASEDVTGAAFDVAAALTDVAVPAAVDVASAAEVVWWSDQEQESASLDGTQVCRNGQVWQTVLSEPVLLPELTVPERQVVLRVQTEPVWPVW
jgi:hypothetical protein